jgi:hypothetical protein
MVAGEIHFFCLPPAKVRCIRLHRMRFVMRRAILCAAVFVAGCTGQKPAVEPVKVEPGLSEEQVKRLVMDAVSKATADVLQKLDAERQQRDAAIRDALGRYAAAVEERDALRQKHELVRREAEEAKRRYDADILKAALATPEQQSRLKVIAEKRRTGQPLTPNELEEAARYYEFQSLVESESKRARTSGLFSGAKK